MKGLKKFIQMHWDRKSPLLLGYSGGPDSKALLYALLRLDLVPLHIAHVDHGWREESGREAELIRLEIDSLGLPFHTIRLTPPPKGNLEAIAREGRLLFFRELREKFSFQATLLAHHANDLAETALKRVLEGAHLTSLSGMQKISSLKGLPIWRPLLDVERSEILALLKREKLNPLIDPSNFDAAYLRARMRSEIFPFLKEKFQKGVERNLALLSQRSLELKEYLDKRIEQVKIEASPEGSIVSFLGLERIEARHLLQKVIPSRLPRCTLEEILDALMAQKANCHFPPALFVSRGKLFIPLVIQIQGVSLSQPDS